MLCCTLLVWNSLMFMRWNVIIYAAITLFIECLLLMIWLMWPVPVIHILFMLCLWSHASGFIRTSLTQTLCACSWTVWSAVLICAASLFIICSGFDLSGWCCCSDTQVFLISSKREFTTHLTLSIRRGALFPLLRFQLNGTDEPGTKGSAT